MDPHSFPHNGKFLVHGRRLHQARSLRPSEKSWPSLPSFTPKDLRRPRKLQVYRSSINEIGCVCFAFPRTVSSLHQRLVPYVEGNAMKQTPNRTFPHSPRQVLSWPRNGNTMTIHFLIHNNRDSFPGETRFHRPIPLVAPLRIKSLTQPMSPLIKNLNQPWGTWRCSSWRQQPPPHLDNLKLHTCLVTTKTCPQDPQGP